MNIKLFFNDNTFRAIATINLVDNYNTDFSFYINSSLTIEKIICNNKRIHHFSKHKATLNFRPSSNLIEIHNNTAIDSLIIQYIGTIDAYYSTVTKDIKSLNWYSVWFPQDTSIPVSNEEVLIYGCEDYIILKGVYDSSSQTWKYDNQNFDPYNIIAYKKDTLCFTSNPYINIYSSSEQLRNIVSIAAHYYEDILSYFNGELFNRTTIPVLDMAFLYPTLKDSGSFKRKDLIVTTESDENEFIIIRMIAHESAHFWCTGADCNSWEDWLNETTAEWSALLYALKRGNNMLFDSILQPHLESVAQYPPIKTSDGTRPLGVHTKGTILFLELYKHFGLQVTEELIRLFSILEIKTTAHYLEKVKIILGDDVFMYISENILK